MHWDPPTKPDFHARASDIPQAFIVSALMFFKHLTHRHSKLGCKTDISGEFHWGDWLISCPRIPCANTRPVAVLNRHKQLVLLQEVLPLLLSVFNSSRMQGLLPQLSCVINPLNLFSISVLFQMVCFTGSRKSCYSTVWSTLGAEKHFHSLSSLLNMFSKITQ